MRAKFTEWLSRLRRLQEDEQSEVKREIIRERYVKLRSIIQTIRELIKQQNEGIVFINREKVEELLARMRELRKSEDFWLDVGESEEEVHGLDRLLDGELAPYFDTVIQRLERITEHEREGQESKPKRRR